METEGFLAVILMLPAVDMDLRAEKVENGWILFSAVLMAAMKLAECGGGALPEMAGGFVLPLIFLWPLFRIRAVGAADCKLLSALGLLLGPAAILQCMLRMFLTGGLLAGLLLLTTGSARERFRYLQRYVMRALQTGELPSYRKSGFRPEHIHMTVPILLSVLMWAAGL